ncbi:MAG: FAD-dependent oxidoreductase [Candidatus Woesearchaeota archaeon]
MVKRFKSKILKKINNTDDVFTIEFERPNDFNFLAGQYINIYVPEIKKMRSYSILSSPSSNKLELCIKTVKEGEGTPHINKRKEGDEVEIIGPLGMFLFDKSFEEYEFICTGTGIVPFMSMINENISLGKKMRLVAGFRYKKDILFEKELKELKQKHKNFDYLITLTKDDHEFTGRVQKYIDFNDKKLYYICGLKELVLETKELLEKQNIKNIKTERYS